MTGLQPFPCVFVHGFADDSTTWSRLLVQLPAVDARCWDLPGHGTRKTAAPELMTRDAAVRELHEHLDGIGRPAILVGHSLGGYLALMATILRPELVSAVALISSGPGFRRSDARESWNAYIDSIAADTGMPTAVTTLAHQPDSFVIDNLGSVRCPLVHIIGSRDHRYRAGADHLRKVLPHSSLVEIDGAGHHPQRTHPKEVAAAIMALTASLERSAD